MRSILFFDLPVEKESQKSAYRNFVKNLKKLGFYMMQESVYVKMGIDIQTIELTIKKIKKFCPKEGKIFVLTITEKQFASIEYLLGEEDSEVICSDKRIIEL